MAAAAKGVYVVHKFMSRLLMGPVGHTGHISTQRGPLPQGGSIYVCSADKRPVDVHAALVGPWGRVYVRSSSAADYM